MDNNYEPHYDHYPTWSDRNGRSYDPSGTHHVALSNQRTRVHQIALALALLAGLAPCSTQVSADCACVLVQGGLPSSTPRHDVIAVIASLDRFEQLSASGASSRRRAAHIIPPYLSLVFTHYTQCPL